MYISVVIPARNEAEGLRKLLPVVNQMLPEAEIIVVDDGSTDDTTAACASANVRQICHPYPKGNGAAIKTGARAAKGDVIVFMDADGQHKPEDIAQLLAKFNEGYGMVVGARQSGSQAGLHRAVANDIFSRFASWTTNVMPPGRCCWRYRIKTCPQRSAKRWVSCWQAIPGQIGD